MSSTHSRSDLQLMSNPARRPEQMKAVGVHPGTAASSPRKAASRDKREGLPPGAPSMIRTPPSPPPSRGQKHKGTPGTGHTSTAAKSKAESGRAAQSESAARLREG